MGGPSGFRFADVVFGRYARLARKRRGLVCVCWVLKGGFLKGEEIGCSSGGMGGELGAFISHDTATAEIYQRKNVEHTVFGRASRSSEDW